MQLEQQEWMHRLRLALAFWVIAASACSEQRPQAPIQSMHDGRPNIVLLMAEDLGPRIGVLGDPIAQTPRLDQFAEEGTRFTEAFATSGVCGPSRAAIVTGIHQNRWGAGHMRAAAGGYVPAPAPYVKAFPEILRASGYQTFNDGKTDYQLGLRLGGAFGGPKSLWDDDRARGWANRDTTRPFFAFINLGQTHESQIWPTWQFPNSVLTWALWPLRIINHWSWPIVTPADEVKVPPYYPDTRTVREDIARHYNNIASLDVAVGKILDQLEQEGLAKNTIVIFTADHGDGFPRAKRWLYDSGLHVPLLIHWPGVTRPGTISDQLISLIDLAPTILSMAKVPPPPWMEGKIFVGPHENLDERPYIFAARDRIDQQPDTVRAVRGERFKYIRHYYPDRPYVLPSEFRDQMPLMRELIDLSASNQVEGVQALWFRKQRDQEELFDTLSDPHEILNLAEDPMQASQVREMRQALDQWLEEEEDLGLLPEQRLRDRFFPNGEQPITPTPTIDLLNHRVSIGSKTEGASIEFRVNRGPWRLYTAPFEVQSGGHIEARAQRYGWAGSEIAETQN
ncbi:MAG: hypothetical protein CBC48_09350 [bacterium TMED88]|nr:sulfatase [Deltaproteobacteria bacterium]OUV31769.1 MAG: hypothetical protein CBC48_09350 [bacterium TMED88]